MMKKLFLLWGKTNYKFDWGIKAKAEWNQGQKECQGMGNIKISVCYLVWKAKEIEAKYYKFYIPVRGTWILVCLCAVRWLWKVGWFFISWFCFLLMLSINYCLAGCFIVFHPKSVIQVQLTSPKAMATIFIAMSLKNWRAEGSAIKADTRVVL